MLDWIGAALRQVRGIVKDSPEFKRALEIVHPLLYANKPTPRSIKRYQNRMRYLATRLRPVAYEPDFLDRMFRQIGQKIDKELVPEAWFAYERGPLLPEATLMMLGALDSIDPDYVRNICENDSKAWSLFQGDDHASDNVKKQLILDTAKQMQRAFPNKWPPGKRELTQYLEVSLQSSQRDGGKTSESQDTPFIANVSPIQLELEYRDAQKNQNY